MKLQAVALIKSKKETWKKFKNNKSKTNYCENYRKRKNKVRKKTRDVIESQENEISKDSKSNKKLFWNYVKQNTNKTN